MIKLKVVDEIVRMYVEDEKSFLYIANYLMVDVKTVGKYVHASGAKVRLAGGGTYK